MFFLTFSPKNIGVSISTQISAINAEKLSQRWLPRKAKKNSPKIHSVHYIDPRLNRFFVLFLPRLWDAATSQLLTTLISHDRFVSDLAFAPGCRFRSDVVDDDLQLISVSEDKTMKVGASFTKLFF
jgi:WD40 repeat protein